MGKLYTPTPFEKLVKENASETPHAVWKAINTDLTYAEFKTELERLERERKIIMHSGLVVWVWNPDFVEKIRRTGATSAG
jgi:hypothetical protein